MHAWRHAGQPVATIPLVDAAGLDPVRTIDVRQASEFGSGHVPGVRHIELGALGDLTPALPGGPLTLACGHGERAMTAASVLAATGRRDLTVLDGGPDDWARATGRTLAR
jgi:rhodanese-related sulfurtransferase